LQSKLQSFMPIPSYNGAWGKAQALHLLRRTTFGPKKSDVNLFAGQSMTQCVNEILNATYTAPAPPLNDYYASGADPDVPAGQTWINAPIDSGFEWYRLQSLRGWWTGLMINEGRSIREKMTLFFHNYLPVSSDEVNNPIMFYEYLALLRANALGNFKNLVTQVTIDRGMLWYLDGQSNQVWGPNENYARELQELFTVGKDLPSYYTQADVVAAAKVLTGWTIIWNPGQPNHRQRAYYPSWHDSSTKTFSSFYNNTVIVGDNSANGGMNEINALMNMIFNQNEVAKYFVRRLYRFFVHYKITPTIENDIIVPLANTFRSSGYELQPLLQELFTSQHFYDTAQMNAIIKQPIQLSVGLAKTFGVNIPNSAVNTQYNAWRVFYDRATSMNQEITILPNVNGWPALTNFPYFHQIWINPDSLRSRKSFFDAICNWGYYSGTIKINTLTFTATLDNPADPNLLIDEVLELTHTVTSDTNLKTQLKAILLSNQNSDYYWTSAWNNYISNPSNTTFANIVESRLKTFYQRLLNMAETNLC
jgi:uncharacterized protein (DUF1800 family)